MTDLAFKTEQDIKLTVESDDSMMQVLRAAASLDLPDWWIGAGFLRNRVWDEIEGNKPQKPRDIDLVYFDKSDISISSEQKFEQKLYQLCPDYDWEVRNQVRMHVKNDDPPYTSTVDAISKWVETATCVAVRLVDDELEFLYCHGSDDLLNMIARPVKEYRTPDKIQYFHKRITEKNWRERWPSLEIIES